MRNRKKIDVLGTSFNVMAYDEEKVVRTTLVEGAIRIGDENEKRVLKPGQQAEWTVDPGVIRVADDADVDAAVAWKNGFFSLTGPISGRSCGSSRGGMI
jgi:ferric-dicitrate binding protein FerR (iron transport regulator)